MKKSSIVTFFWSASLLVVGAVLATVWVDVMQDRDVPVDFHEVWFESDTAMPGETLWLHVDRTRLRWCPGIVREFWSSGNQWKQGETLGASPDNEALGRSLSAPPGRAFRVAPCTLHRTGRRSRQVTFCLLDIANYLLAPSINVQPWPVPHAVFVSGYVQHVASPFRIRHRVVRLLVGDHD